MLRTKTLFAGTEWKVARTTRLYELVIEDGAKVTAPEGHFVTLTVNGVGMPFAPGRYQGDIVVTLSAYFHMAPHGLMTQNQISYDMHAAVVIADGQVEEDKGVAAMVQFGRVTGESAEGVYLASREESFNGIVVTGDKPYAIRNCQIDLEGFSANDFLGVGAAVAAIDKVKLTIENSEFNLSGVTRCAVHVGGDSDVTLQNCTLLNLSPDSDWLGSFSWAVGFRGTNRLTQLTDNATVHYNNCFCKTNGWGVLSIDGSDEGVKMYVKDSVLEQFGPRAEGYGAFCIGDNLVSFDHTTVKVNGFPLLVMGMEGKGRAEIVGGSKIYGRRFGVMVVNDDNSVVTLKDSEFYTEKSTLCVKGSATKLELERVTMQPKNGVLLQLMDDDQSGMNFADFKIPVGVPDVPEEGRDLASVTAEDVEVNITDCELTGDLFNSTTNIRATRSSTMGDMGKFHDAVVGLLPFFDNDAPPMPSPVAARHNGDDLMGAKNLGLNLNKVRLTGVVSSAKQEYREGLNLITEVNREELSNVKQTAAPTVNNGVAVTLRGKSVWTVTGQSFLTSLTVESGSQVTAPAGKKLSFFVNGTRTALKTGSYSGKLELRIV